MKRIRKRIISLLTAVIMLAAMIPATAAPVAAAAPTVWYRTHIQNVGWQGWKSNGATSGTSGKAYRLEGIKIELTNNPYGGGIAYITHIQNKGWETSLRRDGQMSGTSGQALRLEAIGIILYGGIANYYDVYYRVHSQLLGWMGWAKNGENAGTAGYSYRLEAIQIKLVPKGGSAPGSTSNHFLSDYRYITRIGLNLGSGIRSGLGSSNFTRQSVSGYSYYYKGKSICAGVTVAWGSGSNREYIHSISARCRLFTIIPGATKTAKANSIMTSNGFTRVSGNTWRSKSDRKAVVTLTIKNGVVYGFDAYYKKS